MKIVRIPNVRERLAGLGAESVGDTSGHFTADMLAAQCPAVLNQRQTVAIGQTCETSRIEFLSVAVAEPT